MFSKVNIMLFSSLLDMITASLCRWVGGLWVGRSMGKWSMVGWSVVGGFNKTRYLILIYWFFHFSYMRSYEYFIIVHFSHINKFMLVTVFLIRERKLSSSHEIYFISLKSYHLNGNVNFSRFEEIYSFNVNKMSLNY